MDTLIGFILVIALISFGACSSDSSPTDAAPDVPTIQDVGSEVSVDAVVAEDAVVEEDASVEDASVEGTTD